MQSCKVDFVCPLEDVPYCCEGGTQCCPRGYYCGGNDNGTKITCHYDEDMAQAPIQIVKAKGKYASPAYLSPIDKIHEVKKLVRKTLAPMSTQPDKDLSRRAPGKATAKPEQSNSKTAAKTGNVAPAKPPAKSAAAASATTPTQAPSATKATTAATKPRFSSPFKKLAKKIAKKVEAKMQKVMPKAGGSFAKVAAGVAKKMKKVGANMKGGNLMKKFGSMMHAAMKHQILRNMLKSGIKKLNPKKLEGFLHRTLGKELQLSASSKAEAAENAKEWMKSGRAERSHFYLGLGFASGRPLRRDYYRPPSDAGYYIKAFAGKNPPEHPFASWESLHLQRETEMKIASHRKALGLSGNVTGLQAKFFGRKKRRNRRRNRRNRRQRGQRGQRGQRR